MLPTLSGCVHLSVAGGCGGTTWGLQYARESLSQGKHVVWICENIPDGERLSQIFANVSPSAVSKLHLSAVGENTEVGLKSASSLLAALKNIDLVVIDDWTAKTGKVNTDVLKAMNELIKQCASNDVNLIAISTAYEDASGSGWKSRGNLIGSQTWFLHRNKTDSMMRELHTEGPVQEFILTDEGFTPRK
jgi:hypothetical protein